MGGHWMIAELIQYQDVHLYEALAILFNQVLRDGVPSSWNTLTLTSLYKKGPPEDPSNYQGIAVMP